MFRRLLLSSFLALLSVASYAATPVSVSGTNQSVETTGIKGNSFVRFRLRNFAGFVPKVFGTGIIVQAQVDVQPVANGTYAVNLWSNDDIVPNTCGVTGNLACTWYTVEFWNGGKITASGNYCIPNTSSTYDLNVAVPCLTPPLPPGPVQVTNVTGGQINGTSTHVLKFVGPTTAGDSEGIATGTAAALWPLGTNVAGAGLEIQKQNSSSPGTTQYLLAAKDPSTGLARNAQPTDANALIGITHTGAGTTGTASIVVLGSSQCTFDNQTSIGDWAVLGANSECHDAGATQPVGVSSIIKVTSVNSGAGTAATVDVGLPDVSSNSANTTSGGNGTVSPCATNGAVGFYSAIGNTIGCDPLFTDDGAGNISATSIFLNGTGGGFQFFGQGTQPSLSQSNAVYFYAPASVPASFGTALPSAPGTAGQTLVITSVPDATHIITGWGTIACTGSCLGTAPIADQVLTNGWDLVNTAGGGFVTKNAAGTPSDGVFQMFTDAGGRGIFEYSEAAADNTVIFHTAAEGGSIAFNPTAGTSEGNGVVVNNSGLYLAGKFTSGNGLVVAAGNALIAGGGLATGNPILTLGSSGVEGVVKFLPSSGVGNYTLRVPTTSLTNVLSLPNSSGTFAVINAGVLTTPAISLSSTTGTSQCLQADTTGAVTGTGALCAGTSSPGGSTTNLQYNNAGAFGGFADGTSTQVLHGGRTFGQIVNADITNGTIDLTTKVTGVLPTANGGSTNGFFAVSGPASTVKTFTFPNANATVLTSNAAVTVAQGGTGLLSGTSGGILAFTGATTIASSGLLTANSPVLGGGAGVAPSTVAGITTDGVSVFTLGVAGSSVGEVDFKNATSGTVALKPVPTGALGSTTISLPAFTGTAVVAATSTTPTQALFATSTAGAPAFRALASTDIPSGVGIQAATVDLTAQAANVGTTTAFTPSVTGWVLVWTYLEITQTATTSCVLPSVVIGYSSGNSPNTAQTNTTFSTSSTNSLTNFQQSINMIYVQSGVPVTYRTSGYSSTGATSMQFALRMRFQTM